MTRDATVLVIEDDDDIRDTMVEVLEETGFVARGAASGTAALELLRNGEIRPALILLDLMMPGMSGTEFREKQLADGALAAIPVVLVSAAANVEATCAELGAQGFLHKPVKLDSLVEVVARFAPR